MFISNKKNWYAKMQYMFIYIYICKIKFIKVLVLLLYLWALLVNWNTHKITLRIQNANKKRFNSIIFILIPNL